LNKLLATETIRAAKGKFKIIIVHDYRWWHDSTKKLSNDSIPLFAKVGSVPFRLSTAKVHHCWASFEASPTQVFFAHSTKFFTRFPHSHKNEITGCKPTGQWVSDSGVYEKRP
jgi:hypothetical protein